MSERPGPVGRLDRLFAAATLAHEHIADLYRKAPSDHSRELVRESADILLRGMPALASDVRASARVWAEQELLEPPRAAETLRGIESQMAAIEPELRALLGRQVQIARELRDDR